MISGPSGRRIAKRGGLFTDELRRAVDTLLVVALRRGSATQ